VPPNGTRLCPIRSKKDQALDLGRSLRTVKLLVVLLPSRPQRHPFEPAIHPKKKAGISVELLRDCFIGYLHV
jgi:hypothetical protein